MLPFSVSLVNGQPIYEQVVYSVKKGVLLGQLRVGDKFPSVRQLSMELRINPNTAQKVVTNLQQEGLLEVVPGIGTVVASAPSASKKQKEEILEKEVEKLVVEAKRLDIDIQEVQHAVQRHWKKLEKK